MAYTHSKLEVRMGLTNTAVSGAIGPTGLVSGVSVAATGAVGDNFTPGIVPHILRGMSVIATTAVTSQAIIKALKYDLGSTGTLTTGGQITFGACGSTCSAVGHAAVRMNLDTEIKPGERLILHVTDAGAAGTVIPCIYVEPRWERPSNVSGVTMVTA